jgi:hypothetical protein
MQPDEVMAMAGIKIQVSVSKPLYQRLEQTARLAQCEVQDVIVSTLETALPFLPEHLPLEDAADLARLALLDDETLRALAETFLPRPQQRRFTTLLRREEAGHLRMRERKEWEELKHTYLRISRMKAQAQFILDQRAKGRKAQVEAP